MPLYSYICPDKHKFDLYRPVSECKQLTKCPECGKVCRRDYSGYFVAPPNNPRWSNAMGVMPEQIAAAKKRYPGSEYDSEGRLLIKNRQHKKQEMKRRGLTEIG